MHTKLLLSLFSVFGEKTGTSVTINRRYCREEGEGNPDVRVGLCDLESIFHTEQLQGSVTRRFSVAWPINFLSFLQLFIYSMFPMDQMGLA